MDLRDEPLPTEQPPSHASTEATVDASTDDVWEAVTTDIGLAPWLGQGAAIEPAPGGQISAPDPVSGRPREGRVHTVEEQRRVGFTWWPVDDPNDASDVSITVTPTTGGTQIRVTETRSHAGPNLEAHAAVSRAGSRQADWTWRCQLLALSRSRVAA